MTPIKIDIFQRVEYSTGLLKHSTLPHRVRIMGGFTHKETACDITKLYSLFIPIKASRYPQ